MLHLPHQQPRRHRRPVNNRHHPPAMELPELALLLPLRRLPIWMLILHIGTQLYSTENDVR